MTSHGFFAYGMRALDIMEGLPAGIRKDIGWPDALPETLPEPLFGPRATARRG